ncbi:MAG: hypothetical protein KBA31_05925 [Alphaproteobacteria bacterium]|nr:hypothetical protein [Alphaproteobacteria bacterium]
MRSVSAITLLAVSLAGCQTMNDVASVVTGPSKDEAAPIAPAVAAPSVTTVTAAPASSGGLVGMDSDALRSAWGDPSLKRTESGAELWQYGSGRSCTLLVYFYPGAAGAMTVSHAEALPGGTDEAALATCAKAAGKPSLKPIS